MPANDQVALGNPIAICASSLNPSITSDSCDINEDLQITPGEDCSDDGDCVAPDATPTPTPTVTPTVTPSSLKGLGAECDLGAECQSGICCDTGDGTPICVASSGECDLGGGGELEGDPPGF